MDLKRFGCQIDPFAEVPDRRSFYCDALRRRISEKIISSIGRTDGFVILTGEAGAGRTAMLSHLVGAIEARPDCYILSAMPWLTCRQGTSLRELAEALSYARRVARLQEVGSEERFGATLAAGHRAAPGHGWEDGQIAVVILDDAHRLAPQVVVQLRRWRTAFQSVRGPLSIILTTCSEEDDANGGALATSPENAGSADVLMRLHPFERSDAEHLVRHRLRAAGYAGGELFPPEAITRIFAYAKGNPSRIMRLCRRALALASADSDGMLVAVIDAAAQMEFRPQPRAAKNTPFHQTFAASLVNASDLPPTPEMREATFVGADAPGRRAVFGERPALGARTLRLTSATTSMVTVVAAGWLYAAGRDAVMHPIAALESTVSAGLSAVTDLIQPARDPLARDPLGRDQRVAESSVEAALLVEVPQPADAGPSLSTWHQSENTPPQPVADTGTQQQVVDTGTEPVAADPVSPEPEAVENGPILVEQNALSRFSGPDVNELLDRGNSLLQLGDVAAARLFYAMASELGSAEGAMLMGLTFDPIYFEREGVYGTRPHVFEAIEWYRKSASMGNVLAEEQMSALELRLRQAAREGDEDARHALTLLFISPQPR